MCVHWVFSLFCSYYHGTISREEAVTRLQDRNMDGSFLLRQSATQANAYTISLQYVATMLLCVLEHFLVGVGV